MNLPVQDVTLNPEIAYQLRLAGIAQRSFPSRAEVESAVELLPAAPAFRVPRGAGRPTLASPRKLDAPRYEIEVSTGTVAITRRLVVPKVHEWDADPMAGGDAPTRGRISEWSKDSQNNMTRTFSQLDYGEMFASGGQLAMLTLTLPTRWLDYVPDLATFGLMRNQFFNSFRNAWGEPARGIWKLEFQERGAPHLHVLLVPPTGVSTGRGVTRGLPFYDSRSSARSWANVRWSQIVGTYEDRDLEHLAHGAFLSHSMVQNYSDPRRIGSYFSKHGLWSSKSYQNEMPEEWRRAIKAGAKSGARFWGYVGLKKVVATRVLGSAEEVDIMSAARPPRKAVVAMRHLRKLARSRSFVRKTEVLRHERRRAPFTGELATAEMVDPFTGELFELPQLRTRRRRVNRRVEYLKGRGVGFLTVNDGPQTARDIARILEMDGVMVSAG